MIVCVLWIETGCTIQYVHVDVEQLTIKGSIRLVTQPVPYHILVVVLHGVCDCNTKYCIVRDHETKQATRDGEHLVTPGPEIDPKTQHRKPRGIC